MKRLDKQVPDRSGNASEHAYDESTAEHKRKALCKWNLLISKWNLQKDMPISKRQLISRQLIPKQQLIPKRQLTVKRRLILKQQLNIPHLRRHLSLALWSSTLEATAAA